MSKTEITLDDGKILATTDLYVEGLHDGKAEWRDFYQVISPMWPAVFTTDPDPDDQ